jgi:formylmethanofuran dehydrogenase subunit C
MITLTTLKQFKYPIYAENINPDIFKGKKTEEIAELPVFEGNKQKKLGDLFKIEKSPEESPSITINGDVGEVRKIGTGMKNGEIVINGNVGMHLGEKMLGGKITVNGSAGSWLGSAMKKGLIEVHGNAGDYVASPYRGTTEGMKGGKIIVDGNVGSDSGCYVRGGVIKIKGNTGPFLGFHMSSGTIHVEQNAGTRLGANMTGGKIVVSGFIEEIMPSFTIDSTKGKVKIDDTEQAQGPFYIFLGDLAENGTGKLFISKNNNPHLKITYEKYL